MPVDGVTVTRVLRARRELVFEAWTRPDLMARWFFPGNEWTVAIASELTVGGKYKLTMHDAQGGQHIQFGEYREIVPHSRLVFTWNCPELGVESSVVTVELTDQGGQTQLVLTHELPPDPKVRRGHEEGWQGCLGNLEKFLSREDRKETNMNAIRDEIGIKASVSKVYEAITRQSGYRGWWNAVGEVAETVGGEAKLHFIKEGTPVNMKFRIDEMKPNQSVRWTCIGHDMPSWVGTTLNWTLKESAGATSLSFDHGGWKDSAPEAVAQGWKHFLGSLKSYVESGTGQPW